MPEKNDITLEPDPLKVGARMRALRHEARLSQSGLAKLLGVSPGAIGNWEQGQGYLSPSTSGRAVRPDAYE